MAYPLEMPGVIVVDSKKKWVFTEKEKKILAHFVAVASMEVEREKQLREMEEEREEMSLLRRQLNFSPPTPPRRRLHRGGGEGSPCRLRRRYGGRGRREKRQALYRLRGGGRRGVPRLGPNVPCKRRSPPPLWRADGNFCSPTRAATCGKSPFSSRMTA